MKVNKRFIKKITEGNREAEKELFDYTKSKIKEFLETKYPNENNEDDTSDIVIKIFEKIDKFNDKKSKYSTWIINVAKNHMIDKSRLFNNRVMFVTTSNNVSLDSLNITNTHTGDNKTYTFTADSNSYLDFENKDTIKSITSTFNGTDTSLLNMKYVSGYNYEEIGKEMNMNKSQVSNRVNYIKKKIKKGS